MFHVMGKINKKYNIYITIMWIQNDSDIYYSLVAKLKDSAEYNDLLETLKEDPFTFEFFHWEYKGVGEYIWSDIPAPQILKYLINHLRKHKDIIESYTVTSSHVYFQEHQNSRKTFNLNESEEDVEFEHWLNTEGTPKVCIIL